LQSINVGNGSSDIHPDLDVYLFAKNLTANKYYVRAYGNLFTAGLGFGAAWQGEPRTDGTGAQVSF
jgi:hypothetical protein